MLLEERVGQAVTEAEAAQFARELYGLEATAKILPGEYDDNFHLTTIESAIATRTTECASATPSMVSAVEMPSTAGATSGLRTSGSAFVAQQHHAPGGRMEAL